MAISKDLNMVAQGWRWARRPLVPRSVQAPPSAHREFPTKWSRTGLGRAAREVVLEAGFLPLLHFELTPRVFGREALENLEPPVLFAANHSSHIDAPLLLTSLPTQWRRRTATAAAADYFFDVWWRGIATALAFNAFPIERGGANRAGLTQELLDQGWNLVVFPEGTRSRDGWVGKFRHGLARLAIENEIPVVPIGIRGAYQAMPRGKGWPYPGRPPVTVRFGTPLFAGEGEKSPWFTERIRKSIALLIEEDATSWWKALRNAEDAQRFMDGPQGARWRRHWESSRPLEDPARMGRVGRKRAWPQK